jgi:hypothetical protein
MSDPTGRLLNPHDARLFRITHVDNVPWLLDHGLHCQSSAVRDPNFVPIGMASLINKRATHRVPIAPSGVLADYVPFYFTPWSMMLMNINTGYNGVTKRANADIVIVGARLRALRDGGASAVFTDGHAYMTQTHYYDDLARLDEIDWAILRSRNFAKSDDDPDRSRRYQAEALVYQHVPTPALGAIACYDAATHARVEGWVRDRGLATPVATCPEWYF